jgi:hypothetical protein
VKIAITQPSTYNGVTSEGRDRYLYVGKAFLVRVVFSLLQAFHFKFQLVAPHAGGLRTPIQRTGIVSIRGPARGATWCIVTFDQQHFHPRPHTRGDRGDQEARLIRYRFNPRPHARGDPSIVTCGTE